MTAFDLSGRTALVTGGTAGIGLALVHGLLAAGAARVLVVGRDPTRLDVAVREFGPRAVPLQVDLSRAVEVDRLLGLLPDLAPDLSLVINNAGSQRLTDFTREDPHALLPALRAETAANFDAVVALSVGLLPILARQSSAALLNITSGLALAPKMSSPVYCGTKAGVRAFTIALRYQCEAHLPQVRVIEAVPPMVDTAMTKGRGRGKISPEDCAAQIFRGLQAGRSEIDVGKTRLLRAILRVSPSLGQRIMRGW
jgi:uncharacterized oxidoreductase